MLLHVPQGATQLVRALAQGHHVPLGDISMLRKRQAAAHSEALLSSPPSEPVKSVMGMLSFTHTSAHTTKGMLRLAVLDQASHLSIDQRAAAMLASVVPAVSEASSNQDKRNALKAEAGFKSTNKGYATAKTTHWMHSCFMNTQHERSMCKEDMLDAHLLARSCGAMGRPVVPERKISDEFFHRPEHSELLAWMEKQAAAVAAEKRILDPCSAAEDEACTQPFMYLRGGIDVQTCHPELFPGKSPGLSALTLNAQVISGCPAGTAAGLAHTEFATSRDPSSFRMVTSFPPDTCCSLHGHLDNADRCKLEHMGLKHPHLSYLGLFLHGDPSHVCGGEFFVKLTGDISLAVAPSHALPVFGSFYGLWHAAARAYLCTGSNMLDSVRGSVVMNLSKLVARSSACARRCPGLPLASNGAQKNWLVRMGLSPLNGNELTRPKHKALRDKVINYPINNPQWCTAERMQPYVTEAARFWYEYEALAIVEVSDESESDEGSDSDMDSD